MNLTHNVFFKLTLLIELTPYIVLSIIELENENEFLFLFFDIVEIGWIRSANDTHFIRVYLNYNQYNLSLKVP